jgi:hypothetical protein
VDLNRNFPDPVKNKHSDLKHPQGQEQPETMAIMAYTLARR